MTCTSQINTQKNQLTDEKDHIIFVITLKIQTKTDVLCNKKNVHPLLSFFNGYKGKTVDD